MAFLTVGAGGFATIQEAVNASADGDTIVVSAGTYVEQVVVTGRSNLLIIAAAGEQVTIQAPADLIETARSSSDREIHAVFTVVNSTAVTLQDIDIDGNGAGNTVDEGGGAGIANFYGVYYRNASGTLENVDVTAVRDPYPGGSTPGGQPIVDGVQRGIAVVADNDSLLAFAMHGGTISDFQKQAGLFVRTALDISGVTVIGGGAQPVIAQNGFSIQRSTGTVTGNSLTGIGYAGPALAYSGVILAASNFDLSITDNIVGGSNGDSAAAQVVGIWIFQAFGNAPGNSGGVISGNTISFTDVGIAVDDAITPNPLLIENNTVSDSDLTDPYSAGVRFEPMPVTLTTAFDIDGTAMHDKLAGNAGDDRLSGLAGPDTLTGNGGDDFLDGGEGGDTMSGGTGNDVYIVDSAEDVVIENGGEGDADEIRTALSTYVIPANVERLVYTGTAEGGTLRGNSLNNHITGSDLRDIFLLQDGGDDSAFGRDGIDTFYFGAAFTSADYVDGGGNRDAVMLQGDYSGGVTFGTGTTTNIVNVESISLVSGGIASFGDTANNRYSYNLTMLDSNVAAGALMKVNGFHLLEGENFAFDGSAETDSGYQIFGGLGTDSLIGGQQNDNFIFGQDGRFGAGDTIVGGGGYDVLYLRGDYTIDFNAAGFAGALSGVESIGLLSGASTEFLSGGDGAFDYSIVWNDALLGAGATMTVNGSRLGANETFAFDGSLETDGKLKIWGGAAADTLSGGGGDDLIAGGGGADQLRGNGGADVFRYQSVADSTAAAADTILDFAPGADRIDLSRIDARAGTPEEDDAFAFIGSNAFSAAGPGAAGELRAFNVSGSLWQVEGDVDGDGVADLVIQVHLGEGEMLNQGDFML